MPLRTLRNLSEGRAGLLVRNGTALAILALLVLIIGAAAVQLVMAGR